MVLDEVARGELEKHVDRVIGDIPALMSRFREKEFKNILQLKNVDDFLYGVVYGRIIWGYRRGGEITNKDLLEIQTILVKRMREVRDTIFNTG